MIVAAMGPEHVAAVARLHSASLRGVLSQLGEPAVRAYYVGCVRTPAAVCFVALEEGIVRGFVSGSVRPDRLKREVVRRNRWATMTALTVGILKRPSSLLWLVRSLWSPDPGRYDAKSAELTYLAVDAERRGAGAGKGLVDAFTRAMHELGVSSYELSVDEDNQSAIGFYEAQGFRVIGHYREFGTLHRRYKVEWA